MAEGPAGSFGHLARDAVERLTRTLQTSAPAVAVQAVPWISSLAAGPPEAYFTHREAFPMLQLPWWLQESIIGRVDPAFQADLAYSSVCGYYFVRMVDNLMDGDSSAPPGALPALIVLHTEFEGIYRNLFPANSPFWADFTRLSYEAADTAAADARAASIDLDHFLSISARKTAGAKIALAAVCERHRSRDAFDAWSQLTDRLGRWHQMRNDVLGWPGDMEHGRSTYFLSEATRRTPGGGQAVGEWIARDGLRWAANQLEHWMDELLDQARRLGHQGLLDYLEERRRVVFEEWQQTEADLAALKRLSGSLPAQLS